MISIRSLTKWPNMRKTPSWPEKPWSCITITQKRRSLYFPPFTLKSQASISTGVSKLTQSKNLVLSDCQSSFQPLGSSSAFLPYQGPFQPPSSLFTATSTLPTQPQQLLESTCICLTLRTSSGHPWQIHLLPYPRDSSVHLIVHLIF